MSYPIDCAVRSLLPMQFDSLWRIGGLGGLAIPAQTWRSSNTLIINDNILNRK